MNVVHAIVTIIISFVVGFVASWILGFKEDAPQEEVVATVSKDEIVAPCDGTVKPLSEVNDDVFSQSNQAQEIYMLLVMEQLLYVSQRVMQLD